MAECTEVNNIIVEGAGSSSVNGTYIKIPSLVNGYSAWTKDGDGSSYPIIRANINGGDTDWTIVGTAPFPGAPLYTVTGNSATNNTCPVGLTWSVAAFGAGSAPTVTAAGGGGSSEPTFGLPAETVALITSRFGTVANFLRLRNQGQV